MTSPVYDLGFTRRRPLGYAGASHGIGEVEFVLGPGEGDVEESPKLPPEPPRETSKQAAHSRKTTAPLSPHFSHVSHHIADILTPRDLANQVLDSLSIRILPRWDDSRSGDA
jgi:hypothetical protein